MKAQQATTLWFYRDAMEVCLKLKRWDDVGRYANAF